jgi:hypothetical protein
MGKSISEEELRRRNRRKFYWHTKAMNDPFFRRKALALRLLDFIMHRYHTGKGYIEFSNNSAAQALDVEPRQIARAKRQFIERGWLKLVGAYDRRLRKWNANRYDLAGGPEDLILDAHNHGRHDSEDVSGDEAD